MPVFTRRATALIATGTVLAAGALGIGALAHFGAPMHPTRVGRPLVQSWRQPNGAPPVGQVSVAATPATASPFPARPAMLYLPPAALVPPPPRLPVLLVLPGRPAPVDWTY